MAGYQIDNISLQKQLELLRAAKIDSDKLIIEQDSHMKRDREEILLLKKKLENTTTTTNEELAMVKQKLFSALAANVIADTHIIDFENKLKFTRDDMSAHMSICGDKSANTAERIVMLETQIKAAGDEHSNHLASCSAARTTTNNRINKLES